MFRILILALAAAVCITVFSTPRPLDEQLLQLQLQQEAPAYAGDLAHEPADLQALMLMYSGDPVLIAKAQLALLRYPQLARTILLTYGEDEIFQRVLVAYGEDIVLPIQYFREHDVSTLEVIRGLNDGARVVKDAWSSLWGNEPPPPSTPPAGNLTPDLRGWYAIQFLEEEGYDFLGQFVMAPDGAVAWLQSERVLEGINRFFASGLKGLETRWRLKEPIEAGDIGWAALDVAVGVSAFKLLRMGRVGAAAAPTMGMSQRAVVVGSGLWRGSAVAVRLAKIGAPAILVYMAVRHPSLINSMLVGTAEQFGLPVPAVQVAGWTLVLLPVLWLLRLCLGPVAWLLLALLKVLKPQRRSGKWRKEMRAAGGHRF